jgi:hypothetical protein
MTPLRGRKKKPDEETEEVSGVAEVAPEKVPEKIQEEVTPLEWFKRLTESSEVQSDLQSLPDIDLQLSIGNSLVRFVKKGLGKPLVSEERSLRPDATIRISEKAWQQLSRKHVLDELINSYRRFYKNPTQEEFVKVSINRERLVSDSGILRSKLFKNLLLV